MIFLLETMVNEKHIKAIIPCMGFEHFDYVLPINHSGGLAVLWNSGIIHASVLIKEQRAIHMLVHDTENAKNSVISGIYAPAQEREKNSFWTNLSNLNNIIDVPWCLLGDFNELSKPSDKIGGTTLHFHLFQRINNFLAMIDAKSIHVNGKIFTWKNEFILT